MKRAFLFIVIPILFNTSTTSCKARKETKTEPSVHPAVVAGKFYPSDRSELNSMIAKFLEEAKSAPKEGKLLGFVAPHAGYIYSGGVAAYDFNLIKGRRFDTVVVMSPSHHVSLNGASILTTDYYSTPLGKIPINKEVGKRLIGRFQWITGDRWAFSKEHAMEVMLPFLQATVKDLKILPVIIGTHDVEKIRTFAALLLEEFIDRDVLFIASSDFSHYHPYKEAVNIDRETIDTILTGAPQRLAECLAAGKCELCGFPAVYILMEIFNLKGGGLIDLLKYANSGDVTGDKKGVVGYAAIAFYNQFNLSERQKEALLKIAREFVENAVEGRPQAQLKVEDEYLEKPGAAFVTLKKNGNLRGCIGHIIASLPLAGTVSKVAVEAALSDPRFPPVTKDELKDLTYEISVLTPPQPVFDPEKIKVGRDGLIISKGSARGVLLPQVPVEHNWSRERFLEEICHKAGLKSDDWKDKDAQLFRFQAIVF